MRDASPGWTGEALFFSLTVPLIKKGQKRKKQTAKGYQQTKYPDENQYYVCICHITHLPSMYPAPNKIPVITAWEATTLS